MPRNPFAFLDQESEQRRLLLLLQAIVQKQGGEIRLSVSDVTAIGDGSCLFRSLAGDELVLRFAEKGAEAYFLAEVEPRQVQTNSTRRSTIPLQPSTPRHAIHDDVDLALREEEMATHAAEIQKERLRQERAAAGAPPWRTGRPQ